MNAKIRLTIAIALALTISLTGCASNRGGDTDTALGLAKPSDTQPTAGSTPETENTPVEESPSSSPTPALGVAQQYSIAYTDSQGYKFELDLTVYPAIRGSDAEAMQAGWSEVGGTGGVPCEDAVLANSQSTLVGIHTQTSAYAFGTLSVKYLTADFTPPDEIWQFVTDDPGLDEPGYGAVVAAMGVGFGNGAECNGMSTGGFLFHPTIQDSAWGPVPIVLAYDGVFTPNTPGGNPLLVRPILLFNGGTIHDAGGKVIPEIPVTLAEQ